MGINLKRLGKAVFTGGASELLGTSGAEKDLRKFSKAAFEHEKSQRFLPPSLRLAQTGGFLQSGVQGIGELIRNPGQLSPNVAEAILPRLAAESESIAANFRNIRQEQQGAAARGNLPVSIRSALSSALDVAQERAQRGSRRAALLESDQLRRQDLQQTFAVLDAILQFMGMGKKVAVQGLGAAAQNAQQRDAAVLAALGSIGSAAAGKAG